VLDLDDIQGDVPVGLQKDVEEFIFFKILNKVVFRRSLRLDVATRVTSAREARERDVTIERYQSLAHPSRVPLPGLNLGFTQHGLTQLLGPGRSKFDPAFERGADHPDTIADLGDPPPDSWLSPFISDRIDGVFLLTGHERSLVAYHRRQLVILLGDTIKVVYSEIGNTRPGKQRGHEHFGFSDGISQPGIRGLTKRSRPNIAPDQGLPGQALVWPGEFVLGYPGQDRKDPKKPGPIAPLPAPWAANGSYMVFRRLVQRVPEFRSFVAAQARRLGIVPKLLATRMIGRWPSGAPLELAPLEDKAWLGSDDKRNNDFGYANDPLQRACPYAAHIRKVNPRDDAPASKAEMLRHHILRAGIPFGPEVELGEIRTKYSRGLMFVCYQASIENQFEFIQRRYANSPGFPAGKKRPDTGAPVIPGYDPIIGQAADRSPRVMDEPAPNYPYGNRRTTLEIPEEFVLLTAAGYFFMPSISALCGVLGQ
jgi:Dyp-type peroxidase family